MVATIINPLPDAKTQSRNEMFLPASFLYYLCCQPKAAERRLKSDIKTVNDYIVYDWTRKIGIIMHLDSSFKHVSCLHIDNEINS